MQASFSEDQLAGKLIEVSFDVPAPPDDTPRADFTLFGQELYRMEGETTFYSSAFLRTALRE